MIVRDIDLLKQFPVCEENLTITALDDTIRKQNEPNAASVQKRIEALKELNKAGLKTDWKKLY